ncbi:hypothetical protein FQN57_005905 [Myotisia sp. PD_48]|nr:hypothetical protein FQN57_005905 [Myotisia sp. PD_48]
MSKDNTHTLTSDELLAQFDELNIEAGKVQPTMTSQQGGMEHDVLSELENLASQRPSSSMSRPQPAQAAAVTPPPAERSSEDKSSSRKSGDSSGPSHANITPPETTSSSVAASSPTPEPQEQGSGGGWWGGIFATASAAVKQAEAAVKEISRSEDAQKWAEQVRGNVGALRGLGGELRTLAIPTFTTLIHTLAPPISSHERLQIHITHDLAGYPALDPLIYHVFSRVMAQVEGGELLVVQRGQEAAPRRGKDSASASKSVAGWHDGPWWREYSPDQPRSISAIHGTVAATKLARASAESYATEYFAPRGGLEEAARQASEILSESNPVRNSDIFLAVQAISQPASEELFQAGPTGDAEKTPSGIVETKEEPENEISFAIYLHDPIHGIAFHTVSQSIPQQWIDWLDAPTPVSDPEDPSGIRGSSMIPDSIAEIIESGGVDPREWVAEWVEDTITLSVGVVAQRYVARRMGVGEGGINKGKMKAEQASVVDSGAGEAARAI